MQRHPPTPLHTTIQDYAFESSLEFSDGGSLFYKGYKISSRGLSGPSGSEPKSGLSVHDLEFTNEIGKGSSSVVWTAQVLTSPDLLHPHGSPTTVAVKVMHTVHDPDLRRQLFAELQNISPKLQAKPCKNIAKIFDVLYNKDGDRLFIVLEYCNVGSLDKVIKTCGPAPEPLLSVIIRQLFFGLSYLFQEGIQHRDIKPANILMNSKGEVKITDFGSSKADVKSETFCGTTRYMSPERLNGNTYGWQADVWAAGVVMLEAGMGKHPYQAVYGEDCRSAMWDTTARNVRMG